MNNNLFIYWVGHEYPLIKILRELIFLHSKNGNGYNVHLINNNNIKDYIENIPDIFFNFGPAHQADYVRVNVICKYGGIWIDGDTIVMHKLDSLYDLLINNDGFLLAENETSICNGIFGSKPNTKFMLEWKHRIDKIIDLSEINENTEKTNWSIIGSTMINSIRKDFPEYTINYIVFNGIDNFAPIPFFWCKKKFIYNSYNYHKLIVRKYQPLIALVRTVYKELENKSCDEIMNSKMPLNYFINKSIDNAKKGI